MNTPNRARIHWSCRRGMKELDILIMPFFENEYDHLSVNEQHAFIRLLEFQDPQLFSWLMNQNQPDDNELAHIIHLIQQRNKQHGSSSM